MNSVVDFIFGDDNNSVTYCQVKKFKMATESKMAVELKIKITIHLH
jgi:hypothetical protein